MAKNPEKGNLDQGFSGRHESVRASVASGSMWTKPVARITPAAKALAAKNKLESVRRNRRFFPTRGMAMPATPARRMVAIATILRARACLSSRHDTSTVPPRQIVVDMELERFCKKESFWTSPKETNFTF